VTESDRVLAVSELGKFTDRQAGFLVQVMLHSGVCVGRQYCAYARIVRGQKMVDFFNKLVARRYATPYSCGHNKATLYHVHHVDLYEAIGQKHARFRKRMALARAVERLMILDHVIGHVGTTWLGVEDDKVSHFLGSTPLGRDQLPRLIFGANGHSTTRFFPDKLPIGVSPDHRSYVLLHLLVDPATRDFRTFLRRHAELVRALPKWTVRLLVPSGLEECVDDYRRAFREELAAPLHAQVADELRWFCQHGKASGAGERARLLRARRAFRSPRFLALRRAWALDGDRAIDVAMSSSLADAVARGDGSLECHEVSRQYMHLSALVGTA
jgi:hypothetical protein